MHELIPAAGLGTRLGDLNNLVGATLTDTNRNHFQRCGLSDF